MKYVLQWLLVVTFWLSTGANALEKQPYQLLLSQGHRYFNAKSYPQALTAYQQSYQLNDLDSTLYNIAICHYKLSNWSQALTAFEQLTPPAPEVNLSSYQIAVIYKKQQRYQLAYQAFDNILHLTTEPRLADLAKRQIQYLQDNNLIAKSLPEAPELVSIVPDNASPKPSTSVTGSASMSLGFEDNVLSPEDGSADGKGDTYLESLVSASLINNSFSSGKWSLDATYFSTRYSQASDYDLSMLALGSRKHFQLSDQLSIYLGGGYSAIEIAATPYTHNLNVHLGANLAIDQHKLKAEYQYKKIGEDDAANIHLAGYSHNVKARWQLPEYYGGYSIESKLSLDRRNDKTWFIDDDFYFTSYSKNRFSLALEKAWQLENCYLALMGAYYHNRYLDHDIRTVQVIELRRDHQVMVSLELDYELSDQFSFTSELNYAEQVSTHAAYEFTQAYMMAGVSYQF